jgi:hypothetical protein
MNIELLKHGLMIKKEAQNVHLELGAGHHTSEL